MPASTTPDFLTGLLHVAELPPSFITHGAEPAIREGASAIDTIDERAVHQTQWLADALRHLTLHLCAAKQSGHPGGFTSGADVYAALAMLGHTHILTEVGHHAPGFYSAMFLDGSLEQMGMRTVSEFQARFRERDGLLGHLSGAIPGLLAPAGPLGQGQHFALAGAWLHRETLFSCTIGDGGLGEPYVLSAFKHFHTAYPEVTNVLPVLIWNGYSQEHHSMVSRMDNAAMTAYWRAHDLERVILIDAKEFDDADQPGDYVDSTRFSPEARLAFTRAVLEGAREAADAALSGTFTALIIKQLKGAGLHVSGAKSHNLYPGDSHEQPAIAEALARNALAPEQWALARLNLSRAGGGPAARTMVSEHDSAPSDIGTLSLHAFQPGEMAVPATAMAELVAEVGRRDPRFVVTNADGTEASAMKTINTTLGIRHPTEDALYHQRPDGQVYEPLNEDACAGFAAGLALFGGRSLWLSYESFAINGWPVMQTVAQAMAELRRKTPSLIAMFTAGALEQGRNGWTHQRPEIENHLAGQLRNGNVYLLYPSDANMIQAAYAWALEQSNKCIAIIAAKSPLKVQSTPEQARAAIEQGACVLHDSTHGRGPRVVFAVSGDLVLGPVLEATERLERAGARVRVVAVVNPRRLYRPCDVAWSHCAEPDDQFMNEATFAECFAGDVLIGVSGGGTLALEPVMLRSRAAARDLFGWQRGETTASAGELMAFNGLDAQTLDSRARALIAQSCSAIEQAA